MTQEIKIPVTAQVGSLDSAAAAVARSIRGIETAAKGASAGLGQMDSMARRLQSTSEILSREHGRPVSASDAQTFLGNFDRMRSGGSVGSRRLKGFNDFESWYQGHTQSFTSRAHAEAHRRFVMSRGMQGTNYAQEHGGPPSPSPPGGGPPGGGGFGMAGRGMSFIRGGLALAGIGSGWAMASKAVSNASDEGTAIDSLKRRMGDLGVDFVRLRAQARMAGEGLGVTYVEASRLGMEYAREAGNLSGGSLAGGAFSASLRTGIGLGRSYGLDPSEGVGFMGVMRRTGVTSDTQSERRVALMIADAIENGGFTAKADEVLRAVSDFTSTASRITLSAPNVNAYASALSSLMGMKSPGLDPAGAAALLSTADGATRRGGAMGEASMNFTYAALRNWSPGLHPVTGKALMEGGLFGSTSEFYGNSPLAQFYQKNGLKRPGLSFTTNFDKMVPQLKKAYGNGEYLLDATKNHFGLGSYSQAAALLEMQDQGVLGASQRMLSSRGMSLSSISASGLQSISRIAGARSSGDLQGVYESIMGRTDIAEKDKRVLASSAKAAASTGDFEGMRTALLTAVGSADQEKTLATETRDSLKAISDALTDAGSPILSLLNPMRIGIEALARGIVPFKFAEIKAMAEREARDGSAPGSAAARTPIDWKNFKPGKGGSSSAMESAGMRYYQSKGWSRDQAAGIMGNLVHESGLNTNARGDGGRAYGIGQWHPDRQARLREFARKTGKNAADYQTQLAFVQHELETTESAAGARLKSAGSVGEATAAMLAFERPSGWRPGGDPRNAHGWGSRVSHAQRLASTPLPAGDAATAAAGGGRDRVEFGDARVVIEDTRGRMRGMTVLKPVAKPQPAGGVNRASMPR